MYTKYTELREPCAECNFNRFDRIHLDDHVTIFKCQNCGKEHYYNTALVDAEIISRSGGDEGHI